MQMDYISQKLESANKNIVCALFSGNKCQHNRTNPTVFKEPLDHKRRPSFLIESRRRLRWTYFNPYTYDIGKVAFHTEKQNKDGTKRKMRSEIRDAVTHAVGEALLHYVNMEALCVGFYDEKTSKFINLGITKIAQKAGVSYDRAREALRIFEKANLITIEQSKTINHDNEPRNQAALIRLNKQFFYDLGFDDHDIDHYKSREQAALRRKEIEQKRLVYNEQYRLNKKELKNKKYYPQTTTSHHYPDYTGRIDSIQRCDKEVAFDAIEAIRRALLGHDSS